MPMRVVLDNNILVSAAITPTPGQQARAILDQAEEAYTLILSDFILWKLAMVLHYDHIQRRYSHLTEDVIQAHLAALRETGELISERTMITQEDSGSPDPEDNRILAAAVDGQADYVVTRNIGHFPETFRGITIIGPADFLHLLRSGSEQQNS